MVPYDDVLGLVIPLNSTSFISKFSLSVQSLLICSAYRTWENKTACLAAGEGEY